MSPSLKKKKRKHRGSGIKSGMAPGTMVFIGEQKHDKICLEVMAYSDTSLDERPDVSLKQCCDFRTLPGVTWINVNGIHDIAVIEELGKCFELHSLTLEDIVNTGARLKIEEFPHYLFIVMKMIAFNEVTNSLDIEHVSLVLGENYVISFQESKGDVFDPVRERIRSTRGRIRSMKSDYLAYALMDAVVDNYFLAIERIGDRIEEIDDQILTGPKPDNINEIHRLKRDVLNLRKAVWPLREEIGTLEKRDLAMIRPETRVYWRDLNDHTFQIIDMVETFRDMLNGMHDTYLSSMSIRMNEIMKVLTIIATIFIPLTFIVGVYGMNFEYMPELRWPMGYFMIWGVMLAVFFGLLFYFKQKKWM